MKYLKMLGLAALAAMAMMALMAGSAPATTLEVGGAAQNTSVTFYFSLASGTSTSWETTSASFQDTCTSATVKGKTEGSFTGATVGGKVSSLTFGNCTHGTRVVKGGSLSVSHIAGTTNGTVRSTGALWEVDSTTFGTTVECSTNNTHIGTLTGSASGHATLHINAIVNCGFFMPSTWLKASYTITSPTGLGVVA